MRFYAVFMFNLMLYGVHTKPMDQSIVDTINRIDHGSQVELKNEDEASTSTLQNTIVQYSEGTTTMKPGFLAWLLTPLAQSLQINPQSLLQSGLVQLKETLSNLGLRTRDDVKAKQLNHADNLHEANINDPGFYTNRVEPIGFFDGNGWLANKGGALGSPGAILSTGSLLTDYPTAHRRK